MLRQLIPDIASFMAQVGPDRNLEIEARFGRHETGFVNGVDRRAFNRLRAFFAERVTPTIQRQTDYSYGEIRRSVYTPSESPGGQEAQPDEWIRKERLWWRDLPDHGIRVMISNEIPIPSEQRPPINTQPTAIRIKNRTSFVISNGTVRLDLTETDMQTFDREGRGVDRPTTFEVEVEYIDRLAGGLNQINQWENAVVNVLKLLLDTQELYTIDERNRIVRDFNRVLGGRSTITDRVTGLPLIDHNIYVQARNLKLRDMVWGGLVGNQQTVYTVTHKADGLHKSLYFHESGVWLVAAPGELTRITTQAIPQLTGTVVEGELIPQSNRLTGAPNAIYWYLAYDCIAVTGNITIQRQPHNHRMQFAQQVANRFKNRVLTVETKSFRVVDLNTARPEQNFFTVLTEMFAEQPRLLYKEDGFMFTPENIEYNPRSDRLPLRDRILTKVPDICKWKPKEKLTIDFQIQWRMGPTGRTLELLSNERGQPTPFTGTPWNPEIQIDVDHALTANVPSGSIVEYGYDFGRDILVPHRLRTDKAKPNQREFAADIWDDIHNPIEATTLQGRDFVLVRRWHNQIKRALFDGATSRLRRRERDQNSGPGPTLLDIGSGRGGDINKMRRFSKIVLVEPNEEYIPELRRRIELNRMTDRILIVQAGGQETGRIVEAVNQFIGPEGVDVVSSMLSMTFFWQSSDLVDALARTIRAALKPDGLFIALTMNGDAVEQVFEPALRGPRLDNLTLGPATIQYQPGQNNAPTELRIHIADSIVTNQTEWLVRWTDLVTRLGSEFSPLEFHRAAGERFLTQEELLYTQMYSFGSIARASGTGDNTLPTNPLGLQLPTTTTQPMNPQGLQQTVNAPSQLPMLPQISFPNTPNRSTLPTLPTLPTMSGPTALLGGGQQSMIPTMGTGPVARSPMRVLPTTTTTIVESQNANVRPNFNVSMNQPEQQQEQQDTNNATTAGFDDEDEDEETVPVVPLQRLNINTPTRTNPITGEMPRLPAMGFNQPPQAQPQQGFGQQPLLPQLPQVQQGFGQQAQVPQQPWMNRQQPQMPQLPQLPTVSPGQVPMARLPTVQAPTTPSRVSFAQLPPVTQPPMARLAPLKPLGGLPGANVNNIMVNPNVLSRPVEQALPVLPVIPPQAFGNPNAQNQPAQGDDQYAPVACTWYTQRPLVRIATLGDGSCFFHATLKGFYRGYQNNASFAYRSQFVAALRRDLAFVLGMQNPSSPGQTFYETTANGAWVNMAEQQQMGLALTDDFGVPVDYSLAGMQRLFNSRRDVGDEVYQFVSDMLGVDIFVVRGTDKDLYVHLATRDPNNPRRAVVIVGNGIHYEVVAVDHGPQVGFQTVFNVGDPFISALELQRPEARRQQGDEEQLARNGTIIDREAGLNPEPDQLYQNALSPRTVQYNQDFANQANNQQTVIDDELQYGGQGDPEERIPHARGRPGRGLGSGYDSVTADEDEVEYNDDDYNDDEEPTFATQEEEQAYMRQQWADFDNRQEGNQ